MTRSALVEAARGDRPLDLIIRGGEIVNVYTGEIARADIGIFGDRIAVVDFGGAFGLTGREEIDARGLIALPGFVDTHVHIESTMVTPPHFARAVLPFGTTTVVIDPHEIGNVTGRAGVEYMLRASEGLPLRVFVTVPSSVPAVPSIETAGAAFDADDVAEMLRWPRVVGVAELMDYPGIVKQEARTAAIAEAGLAAGKNLEGHAPLLSWAGVGRLPRRRGGLRPRGARRGGDGREAAPRHVGLRAGEYLSPHRRLPRRGVAVDSRIRGTSRSARTTSIPPTCCCTDTWIAACACCSMRASIRRWRCASRRSMARCATASTISAPSRRANWPILSSRSHSPISARRSSSRAGRSSRGTGNSSRTSRTRRRHRSATPCASGRSPPTPSGCVPLMRRAMCH